VGYGAAAAAAAASMWFTVMADPEIASRSAIRVVRPGGGAGPWLAVAAEACIEKVAAALLEEELAAALVEEGGRREGGFLGRGRQPKQDVLGHFRSYRAWKMYKSRVKLQNVLHEFRIDHRMVEISPRRP
jgi:hypothetical protein